MGTVSDRNHTLEAQHRVSYQTTSLELNLGGNVLRFPIRVVVQPHQRE